MVGDVVIYSDGDQDLIADGGDHIWTMDKWDEQAEIQALKLAAAKWGTVRLESDDDEWKRWATRIAAQIGVRIANEDMADEWEQARAESDDRWRMR